MDRPADPRARRRRLRRLGGAANRRRAPRRQRRDDDVLSRPRRCRGGGGRIEQQLGLALRHGRARRADAAPPCRTDRLQVGLGGAEDEAPLRARHRDVEPVQLLALACPHLLVERGAERRWAAVLVVDEGAAGRPRRLDRPFDEQRRRRRIGALRFRVHHEHRVGLEPLRAVHGEQAHGRRAHRQRRLHGALLERPHERIGRRIATAVEVERLREQRVDRVERERALLGRHRGRVARVGVALDDDAIEQVVRRQRSDERVPARKERSRALERRARRLELAQRAPPARACRGLRADREQVEIGRAEQRAAQRAGEREVVAGRDERVEKRDQVLRFRCLGQQGVFHRRMADVAELERVGDETQRLALAAEHVDLVGARAGRDLRHHGLGDRLGLLFAQHLFDDQPRRGEAVAPERRRRVVAAARRRPRRAVDARQRRHLAPGDAADLRRVAAKPRKQLARGAEHAVDRLDHRRCVAARVIAGEDAAAERLRERIALPPRTRAARRVGSDRCSASDRRR